MDLMEKILELSRQGYFCSQILGTLLLETVGSENPELIRALGGLDGGIGHSGSACGCLTAGCCVISYFTGKGEPEEEENPLHKEALSEYVRWFKEEMLVNYGGTDCADITDNNPARRVEVCPGVIADAYMKCMEILSEKEII